MNRLSPFLLVAVVPAMFVAGCSERSQDATANAADSIAADANATSRKAIGDVDAATDRAVNAAQNTMDGARPTLNGAVDDAGRAAKHARHDTGKLLKDAGNAME